MRFKPTNENLRIRVSPAETAECVRRLARLLVPRHTRKVYLYEYMKPAPFTVHEKGLSVVDPKDLPSNLHHSFRIILRSDEIVVVSGPRHFTCDEWRDLAAALETYDA